MSHETIYRLVYADKSMGVDLYMSLKCHRKRQKRCAGGSERRGQILGRRPICERPRHIEERRQIGYWEGYTLIGKGRKHAKVSLVERKTRYAVLAKSRTILLISSPQPSLNVSSLYLNGSRL